MLTLIDSCSPTWNYAVSSQPAKQSFLHFSFPMMSVYTDQREY